MFSHRKTQARGAEARKARWPDLLWPALWFAILIIILVVLPVVFVTFTELETRWVIKEV